MSATRRKRSVKDRTGLVYGLWTVVSRAENAGTRIMWLCRCGCGAEKIIGSDNLSKGKTYSCGCQCGQTWRDKRPQGQAGFTALLSRYKYSAKRRKHTWELTDEEFRELTRKPCFYCQRPPSQVVYSAAVGKISEETREHGSYTYTGVDRRNNALGYTVENCVPCCKHCNLGKHQMTEQEFVEYREESELLKVSEVAPLVTDMRKLGVAGFEFRGLKVNFAPNAGHSVGADGEIDDDPFIVAERVKNAVEQFNKVNREDEINLNWST